MIVRAASGSSWSGKAAKCAADVLLAIAAHQLGDLRAESGLDLGDALGVVGQEVDRGELDRLEERAGFTARRAVGGGAGPACAIAQTS